MPTDFHSPHADQFMQQALELARRGIGRTEPNPAVGAVIVRDGVVVGSGWHQQFGGPHAEVEALLQAGSQAAGADLYVTLEPCCHHGKTPPCSQAVLAAGVRRVFVGCEDPAAHVAGGGIAELRAAGVEVQVGILEESCKDLIAPFRALMCQGRPFVHGKWAMTLDGKVASRTGHSQWISGPESRECVHQLRGRMDAIAVGMGTLLADDPLLTARPPGPRVPVRIVIDTVARTPLDCRLLRTLETAPVWIATTDRADEQRISDLQAAGAEVLVFPMAATEAAIPQTDQANSACSAGVDLSALLQELGRRQITNLLVEGGAGLLGSLFDGGLLDETHVFIAPKIVGGRTALSAFGGEGLPAIPERGQLRVLQTENFAGDLYIRSRFAK